MSLRVGDIYLVQNDEIKHRKEKFSICVCVASLCFVLINSENRKIYDCTPIRQRNHNFLTQDSFISCCKVFYYPAERINPSKFRGRLTLKELRIVRDKLLAAELISDVEKEQIRKAINAELESED